MSFIISVLTVLFVILCLLLIVVILLQSDKSAGMGILGGASQSTFGSSTADVITKITTFMVVFFMVGSLGLAVLESTNSSTLKDEVLGKEKTESGLEQQTNTQKEKTTTEK